jgi:hypothetical protein
MRSVTVRLRAAEFPTSMKIIGGWLSANRYEPMRYKYDHRDDDVLVTIDFPGEAERSRDPSTDGLVPVRCGNQDFRRAPEVQFLRSWLKQMT